MKEAALVIIKPDGISKGLTGSVLNKFDEAGLDIIGIQIAIPTREIAEKHYQHLKGRPFFEDVISYIMGKFHKKKRLLAVIYYGENAIRKCRKIAGATNPEEADPASVRGSFGRITTKGIYENVVHVSSDKGEARREIKLWFPPDEIIVKLYPTKRVMSATKMTRVWA